VNLNITDYLTGNYLAKLGPFIFKASSVSFNKLSRSTKYEWKKQKIVNSYPVLIGGQESLEKLVIQGELFSGFHRLLKNNSLDTLRDLAKKKKPLTLTFTDVFRTKKEGLYVISAIRENSSIFSSAGSPLQAKFTLELIKYENENEHENEN
jgi:phage protein U